MSFSCFDDAPRMLEGIARATLPKTVEAVFTETDHLTLMGAKSRSLTSTSSMRKFGLLKLWRPNPMKLSVQIPAAMFQNCPFVIDGRRRSFQPRFTAD